MKLFTGHPCCFSNKIKNKTNKEYFTCPKANTSFSELKNNTFYVLNLKEDSEIQFHSCLCLFKDGKLKMHKNIHWKEDNGNDLDHSNYEDSEFKKEYHSIKCFTEISIQDYVLNNKYYDDIIKPF